MSGELKAAIDAGHEMEARAEKADDEIARLLRNDEVLAKASEDSIALLEAEVERLKEAMRLDREWRAENVYQGNERIAQLEEALQFGIRVLEDFKSTKLRSDGGLCMCDAEICIVHDFLREFRAALASEPTVGEILLPECPECGLAPCKSCTGGSD